MYFLAVPTNTLGALCSALDICHTVGIKHPCMNHEPLNVMWDCSKIGVAVLHGNLVRGIAVSLQHYLKCVKYCVPNMEVNVCTAEAMVM